MRKSICDSCKHLISEDKSNIKFRCRVYSDTKAEVVGVKLVVSRIISFCGE